MTSNAFKYYSQNDFRGGICDQQENLRPNQVLDARNVWAPLGTCVRRPGYQAIGQYTDQNSSPLGSGASYVDGTTIYFGCAAPFPFLTFTLSGFAPNTNAGCQYRYEYWNGSAWMAVPSAIQYNANSQTQVVPLYCGATDIWVYLVPPADWALTTVNSLSRYWLKYVPAGFQSSSTTPVAFTQTFRDNRDDGTAFGLAQFRYNSGSNYVLGISSFGQFSSYSFIGVGNTLHGGQTGSSTTFSNYLNFLSRIPQTTPAQATVVPEFNLAYLAYNNVVYQITNTNTIATATVNSDPLIIGPNTLEPTAPYPTDLVPQLPAFPQASLIINFRNLIFAAGIKGQPTLVRWSGAVNEGAFNVWPETSFETLSTAKDNSPITALAGLGDNLVAFKQDSIWQLVYNGLDDQELPTFVPQLVVAGVGCVSQGSVQEVRGRLIFLAEDGFYAFDGTPNIKKISENVNETAGRINPSHRPFATAVNWRSQHAYLCSVALDESDTNNLIFVYDYKHDAWWLWDNIPAEFLLLTSDTALEEQVIFGNTTAGFFKLIGETDNFGDIDNYVLTGRFGQNDALWKTAREVRLRQQNIDGATTYSLFSDDLQLGVSSKTCNMDSPNETQASPAPLPGCDNVPVRRRERKMPQRLSGSWFQVKAEDFGLLEGISLGYLVERR